MQFEDLSPLPSVLRLEGLDTSQMLLCSVIGKAKYDLAGGPSRKEKMDKL
jgi:hypothetical protein